MRASTLVLGLGLLTLAASPPLRAEDQPVEVGVVDAFNKVFGPQHGFRAVHAKGVVVTGTFKGTAEGAALSKAAIFSGATIPVTVRFSDNTGIPAIPDGIMDASPRGMALKFRLPDGSDADMVTNSLKVFPVSTAEDLRDLLLAAAASGPDVPSPKPIERFVAAHPSVLAANAGQGVPDSFAHEEYRGINAFMYVDKAGKKQAVRIVIVPERVTHIDLAEAARKDPDFLMKEIGERLKAGPVTFRMEAQIAAPGDPTNDPSKAWPEDRKRVVLGTITLDKAVPDSATAEKALLYLPGALPDGIEPSDDPMIDVRNSAYAVSFSRRQ